MDINEIGATAFVISCMRAMEKNQEHKLFDDPYAALFVNEAIEEKVQEQIRVFPPSLELVRFRVCVMSEVVERGIADGMKQIISLGAGFDMRAHIYQTEGVRFCDVDQPAVLQFKNKVLEAGGVTPCAGIECNYLEADLPRELNKAGFDLEAPILFIWEGNTMYLPVDLIHDFLARMRAQVPRMTIAFDYFSEKIINRTSGDDRITEVTDFFENNFNVKWVTGFDDLSVLTEKHGFEVVESESLMAVGERRAPQSVAAVKEYMDLAASLLELYSYSVLKAS
ncbi:MAG: SAM-dependent methyltransferase [Nitrospinae bacterium]|nr:SAM-dependent methyltransferase [Nitrospinota bacterium]